MPSEEIIVAGEEASRVVDALTSVSFKILELLTNEQLDVSTIAERLELSEAYISEQMRLLEDLKFIRVRYERGKKGIRKICQTAVKKITILINPKAS